MQNELILKRNDFVCHPSESGDQYRAYKSLMGLLRPAIAGLAKTYLFIFKLFHYIYYPRCFVQTNDIFRISKRLVFGVFGG